MSLINELKRRLDVSQVLVEENMKDASALASRLPKDAAPRA